MFAPKTIVVAPEVRSALAAGSAAALVRLAVDAAAATAGVDAVVRDAGADAGAPDDVAAGWAAVTAGVASAPAKPALYALRTGGAEWTLVSFVPEGVHPKTKMTLAHARDDVKKACAPGGVAFAADYHVTEAEEATLAAFLAWRDRSDRSGAMSSLEKQMAAARLDEEEERERQVKAAAAAGAGAGGGNGLRPLTGSALRMLVGSGGEPPVALSPPAKAALERLGSAAGGASGGLVALALTAHAGGAPSADLASEAAPGADLAAAAVAAVNAAPTEPRVLLVRPPGGPAVAALLLHVPEGAPPRARVAASGARRGVTAAAAGAGCPTGRVIETRDADDVSTAVAEVLTGGAGVSEHHAPAPASEASSSSSSSSSAAAAAHKGVGSPPRGGVALPGIGGGVSPAHLKKPGHGGVALPGLGSQQ
jgi:hypothetical protein